MADDNLDQSSQDQIAAEAERRQQEELQRQAVEQARIVQQTKMQPGMFQGQPTNGSQEPQFSRGVEYAQRGLPMSSRTISEDLINQPSNPTLGVGQYINRSGDFTGPTYAQGYPTAVPRGTVGVEGMPSVAEQQFWAAHPNGAVVDFTTGNLVGLGDKQPDHLYSDQNINVLSGVGAAPPGTPGLREGVFNPRTGQWEGIGGQSQSLPRQFSLSDFTSPLIEQQKQDLQNQISDQYNRLRTLGPHSRDYAATLANLRTLQGSYDSAVRAGHQQAQLGLSTALVNQKLEQETAHTNNGTAMVNFIYGLDPKKYPPGSQARDQAWAQGLATHPEWLAALNHNPELGRNVNELLTGHATVQQQLENLQPYLQQGETAVVKGAGPKGAEIAVKPGMAQVTETETQKSIGKALANQGVTPEQFAQRTKVERGTYDKNGTFTNSNDGPHVRVTIGNSSFGLMGTQYDSLNKLYPSAQPQTTRTQQPIAQPQQQSKPFQVRQNGVVYTLQSDGTYK